MFRTRSPGYSFHALCIHLDARGEHVFFFLKGAGLSLFLGRGWVNIFSNKLRQVWYHYFLVIFVLLVTAIGSSIFVTGKYLVEHPFEAPSLLASNMPKSTHFYLSSSPQGCVFDGPPGNCFRHVVRNARRASPILLRLSICGQTGLWNQRGDRPPTTPHSQKKKASNRCLCTSMLVAGRITRSNFQLHFPAIDRPCTCLICFGNKPTKRQRQPATRNQLATSNNQQPATRRPTVSNREPKNQETTNDKQQTATEPTINKQQPTANNQITNKHQPTTNTPFEVMLVGP